MMRRILLLQFKNFEIRVHLFEDATETYKHNHSINFYSFCLSGAYKHTLWEIDESACNEDGTRVTHYQSQRAKGGGLSSPVVRQGGIKEKHSHLFEAGNLIFLDHTDYHTVSPPEVKLQTKVATMTIRSTHEHGQSTILSKDEVVVGPTDKVQQISAEDGFKTIIEALGHMERHAVDSGEGHDVGMEICDNEASLEEAARQVERIIMEIREAECSSDGDVTDSSHEGAAETQDELKGSTDEEVGGTHGDTAKGSTDEEVGGTHGDTAKGSTDEEVGGTHGDTAKAPTGKDTKARIEGQ
jgi:hypothetical protein